MFLQKKRTPLQATRLFTDRTATDSRLSPALGTIQALGREEEAEKVNPYLVRKRVRLHRFYQSGQPIIHTPRSKAPGRDLFSNCLHFPLEKSSKILYFIVFRI